MAGRLFDRIKSTGRLPTLPEVVARLLEVTRREDAALREIADILAYDSLITAKIMRFVNSPMAGLPRKINSLPHAVAMVGMRTVKLMALSFTVLGSKGAEACRGFNQRQFATQSVACGVAAKVLASAAKLGSTDDVFLAGLLSQIGRSVLAIGVPQEYAKVLGDARQIPHDLPPLEQKVLGETYPDIGAQLLRSWHIPETLCEAIAQFRRLDPGDDGSTLSKILHVSELAAGLICPESKGELPEPLPFVTAAGTLLQIERERCGELISKITNQVAEMRSLLELPPANLRPAEDIEHEVNERVRELTVAVSIENQRLAAQQGELLRRATTDGLTGIGNRAGFDARMALELRRAVRYRSSLALLLIDVDRFKSLNDTHGHQAGDRALQVIARILESNIRQVDYLARYGGEEFAVIAPDTTGIGVATLAERLRQAIEGATVAWEGRELVLTISIGATVHLEVVNEEALSTIIRAADAQLYAAKSKGRNQVRIAVDGGPPAALRSRA